MKQTVVFNECWYMCFLNCKYF